MRRIGAGSLVLFLLSMAAVWAGAPSDVADAVMRGDQAAVEKLIAQHADVNAAQADGATALHWAVFRSDQAMVKLLLHAGADPKAANRDGSTPLWLACINGSAPIIADLLAAGADAIFFAVGGSASAEALSLDEYRELVLPHDLTVLRSIPSDVDVFLHLCGPSLNFEVVADLPVAAVSWAATLPTNPSLAEGRDRTGLAVLGGVPELDVLANGSATDVSAAVAAAVADTGGRGLIVGPGCSVPPSTSDANLAAMSV